VPPLLPPKSHPSSPPVISFIDDVDDNGDKVWTNDVQSNGRRGGIRVRCERHTNRQTDGGEEGGGGGEEEVEKLNQRMTSD
jgi:hypothetical protein